MTSSANAIETVVFSQLPGNGGGGAGWEHWELDDSGRAEMPLEHGNETHVVGMGLSLCSQMEVHLSEFRTQCSCTV